MFSIMEMAVIIGLSIVGVKVVAPMLPMNLNTA